MLNYNDQMVAQERYEDMRCEAARDALANELQGNARSCLLYTSDAADERSSVDLGGRRIIKKKKV